MFLAHIIAKRIIDAGQKTSYRETNIYNNKNDMVYDISVLLIIIINVELLFVGVCIV